jgi:hypothetical protein
MPTGAITVFSTALANEHKHNRGRISIFIVWDKSLCGVVTEL